eukprot:TRINITY_DN1238_c0_g1_i3.p1 TRINITY_DN1238_c0_g1~~TRINITY_DN1238_c0_g1_i3.p1  ORF type:complete len:551 (-),score=64.62 TRINITY_DN1238_c0_g1_i3:148-1767(-)
MELTWLVWGFQGCILVGFCVLLWLVISKQVLDMFGVEEIAAEEIKVGVLRGEGSFGQVHAGKLRGSDVAIKIPRNQVLTSKQLDDLRNEIQNLRQSQNNNVLRLIGVCTQPGNVMIITELLDSDLHTLLIKNRKPTDTKPDLYTRILMAQQAALGLNWLHCKNPPVIHRDLKLQNMFYKKLTNDDYLVKIGDFGFATAIRQRPKQEEEEEAQAQAQVQAEVKGEIRQRRTKNHFLGSPVTMAPEIFRGGDDIDHKVDVYAYGICLWEMFTLQSPYPGASRADVREKVEKKKRPKIPDSSPQLLKEMIEQCWDDDPTKRPGFHDILKRFPSLLLESAIPNPLARNFWESDFSFKTVVPLDDFVRALYQHFQLPVPQDDGQSTKDEAVLKLRALKEIVRHPVTNYQVDWCLFGHVVDWFAPFDKSMLTKIWTACQLPCFHGHLSEPQIRERMGNAERGEFLVRLSVSQRGSFAVTFKGEQQLQKFSFLYTGTHFSWNGTNYNSIGEVLEGTKTQWKISGPISGHPYSHLSSPTALPCPDYD